MISENYAEFLARKSPADVPSGLSVVPDLFAIVPLIKRFQERITHWGLRRGRAAIFAGTGLGKTLMQLLWAYVVAITTGRPVLILCPLAVAEQTVAEALKWGIPGVGYAADQSQVGNLLIVVTNYERFEKFTVAFFIGIVLDESGVIKAEDGKTRKMLTEACRSVPWRLCCTATPAPNDYAELGQHAEFLGVMDAKEMLAMFFVHDGSIRAGDATQGHDGWRMKRHAANDFWRWLASWSVMVRHPRDLGFDEPGYDLPPLNLHQVTVAAEYKPTAGELFPMMANTLSQRIGVRRDTADERCNYAVNIIDSDGDTTKLVACQIIQTTKNKPVDENICENTTVKTRKSSKRALQSNAKSAISSTKSDGQTIQIFEKPDNEVVGSALKNEVSFQNSATRPIQNIENLSTNETEKTDSSKFMASPESSGTACSPIKGVDALFAARDALTLQEIRSGSTIATTEDLSGGFFVHHVTRGSEISETTETFSPEQLNTSMNFTAKWIIWCQLDKEQHQIAKLLGERCFSIYGSLPNDEKISRMRRWLAEERPILISKPKIFGYGMNLQCCHKMVFVGATDSFEQTYQAVRRCWRFGQTRPVDVYFIASELEGNVVANLKRKELAFEMMLDAMSVHMCDLQKENVIGGRGVTIYQPPTIKMELPSWLT